MTFRIRESEERDFDAIMGLVRACYGETAEPRTWWRWRYFAEAGERTRIVVAESEGALVGMQPMSTVNFRVEGQDVQAGILTGVMVSPTHRRKGIFNALISACLEKAWTAGLEFVATMPNDRSYPGFIKMGWDAPGERRLSILPLFPSFTKRIRQLDVARVPRFSEKSSRWMEGILDRHRLNHQVRLHGWLQWRYGGNPLHDYERYEARLGGDLMAAAITTTGFRSGLKVGYLMDLVCEEPEHAAPLLAEISRDLRAQGTLAIVSVASASTSTDLLRRNGFLFVPRRIAPKRFYYVFKRRPGAALRRSLGSIANWHLMLGDWDGL